LLVALLAAIVLAIAVASLARLAHEVDLRDIPVALDSLPAWRIAVALACTGISHLLLTLYDVFALRAVGAKVPWRIAARAAFTSYTLSHNLGFGAITGGSARLRIYGAAGLKPVTVAQIVLITGLAFWGGVIAVAAFCLMFAPGPVTIAGVTVASNWAHMIGAACVALAPAALLVLRLIPGLRRLAARIVPLPGLPLALLLIGTAALDLAFAALALVVLLPALSFANFPQLYLVYTLAVIAGLVTHVPGGIGVFEAVFLSALPETGSTEFAALIAYRAIYYLLPLITSLALNTVVEVRSLHRPFRQVARAVAAVGDEIGPVLFGAMSFGGGLMLLLSDATPALHTRLKLLVEFLPLPFIEASHLAASLVGTGLLLVAPALTARLDSGMRMARLLFLLGAALSLAKGLDIEEASVMLAMAGLLQLAGRSFYRKARGAFSVQSSGWLAAAAIGLALTTVSGIVAYRHLPYDGQLWWEFCLHGDAPRFLRASFAAGVLIAGFALRLAFWRPQAIDGLAKLPHEVFERATTVCPRSDAALALTGDKRFLVSPEGDAFIMFRAHGRSCVVMGDPVGPRERWRALVWELRRLADHGGVRPCFYQISAAMLPLIVELGLRPIKYGEEAQIATACFALSGSRMKSLRNSHARAAREGLQLEIVPAVSVPAWLARLKPVSDTWLKTHGETEKSFSLGRFEPRYLEHFDLAVVLDACEEPIAFANIWHSGNGEELSVDLMRQTPTAPPGTMDFLLVELLLQSGARGFTRFNLGMAPLSGVQGGKLAPAWARLACLAFSVEGWRYNFAGLRHYKDKFAPEWESRFIATPSGLAGWRSLLDLVRLINDDRPDKAAAQPVRGLAPSLAAAGLPS
jgi:phosphatidylglycerol lysyltransferase